MHNFILIRLIECARKGVKKIPIPTVGTMLSPPRNPNVTGPTLNWHSADGFQRQLYPLLASRVWDYPNHDMIAQVSYGSCPICNIPKDAPMGHSSFPPLNNSSYSHVHLELQDKRNIGHLKTLLVHPFCNQYGQFLHCNVYQLWQPDELHQPLFRLVKGLLLWLLKYMKATNMKDQFDN
jgi:hypothetical protein